MISKLRVLAPTAMQLLPLAALTLTLLTSITPAQSQSPPSPSFDVATIKPVDPSSAIQRIGIRRTANGIEGSFVTITMLMQNAYASLPISSDDQIVNLPDWAKTQRYHVEARISETDAAALALLSKEEQSKRVGLMLQSLLAQRFNLKIHTASKQIPVYEMVVAKTGLKMKLEDDPDIPGPNDKPLTKGSFIRMESGRRLVAHQYSMPQLATFFTHQARELGRMVIDNTGLRGLYSFTLNWSPGGFMISTAGDITPETIPDAPSLFTALQEIGLKLQPATHSVDTLVVDHVDRPSAN